MPTIRHWTKEGLLGVAELTESGYSTPEMKTRCEEIKAFKEKRLTLGEQATLLIAQPNKAICQNLDWRSFLLVQLLPQPFWVAA